MLNGSFKQLYLVQGIFLQDEKAIIDAAEEQIMDKRGLYHPNPSRYFFCGCIYSHESLSDGLVGMLTDKFGRSTLTSIHISETELSFLKTYAGRDPKREGISYTFQKHDDKWVGLYSSSHTGSERAQCILTPVTPGEFDI